MPPKTAKKAAKATKAAPAEESDNGSNGRRGLDIDPKLARKVAKMRDEGTSFTDIADELEISSGKAQLLNMYARVDEDDRITGTETQVAKQVVKQRDAGYSWGALMARTGIGEARLRKMYEEQTGTSTKGNRIGKGGRYPAGEGPAPAKAVPAKKAAKTTKKAVKAGKAEGAEDQPRSDHPLADMSLVQLKKRLEGRTIKVNRSNGKVEAIKVRRITKKSKDGELFFSDNDGKARSILLAHVASASK